MNVSRDTSRKQIFILFGILGLYLLTHLYGISDPPAGFHEWRESDTAAVAESFYKESKNFFLPRSHHRGNKTGITGMEFPIYNYLTGCTYHLTGLQHWVPRLLSVLIGAWGLAGIFYLGRILFNASAGLWASGFALCSPLFFFYSRKIQPDIIIFSVITWALYYFIQSEQKKTYRPLILSMLLVLLGALIKPTALFIGLPILAAIACFNRPGLRKYLRLKYVLFLFFTIGLALLWNGYAKYVNKIYGVEAFFLGEDMLGYWANTNWAAFIEKIFLGWLFELFMGVPIGIGLIIGILYRRQFNAPVGILLSWIAGCYVVFFIAADHMSNYHDYYGLIIVPALSLLSGYYIPPLLQDRQRWLRGIAALVLLGAIVYVWPRIGSRYGDYHTGDFQQRRSLINQHIPLDARITIEDETPSVQLYRAGRFGWTFKPTEDDELILSQHTSGAQYAVFFKRGISSSLAERLSIIHQTPSITIAQFRPALTP